MGNIKNYYDFNYGEYKSNKDLKSLVKKKNYTLSINKHDDNLVKKKNYTYSPEEFEKKYMERRVSQLSNYVAKLEEKINILLKEREQV